MPDTLAVRLNRARLHSLEVPATFGAEESFTVEIENHGEAMHVHLRLDDSLSEVASIATTNHYVRGGATERVPVIVHESRPARGTLTVATAYGNETADVDVRIEEPTTKEGRVEIDQALVERPRDTGSTGAQAASAQAAGGASSPSAAGGGRAQPSTTGGARPATAGAGTGASAVGGPSRAVVLTGAIGVVLAGLVLLAAQSLAPVVGAVAVLAGLLVVGYVLLY